MKYNLIKVALSSPTLVNPLQRALYTDTKAVIHSFVVYKQFNSSGSNM